MHSDRVWARRVSGRAGKTESAVDRLADIAARDLRKTTQRLLVRQRSLENLLTKMADSWHAAHCRTTQIGSFRDCYHAVCKRNTAVLAEHVRVGDEPGGA